MVELSTILANAELVGLSFLASMGFGIVFRIQKQYLLLAGLSGALTRIVYLCLLAITDNRAIYMLLAAMFAAAVAEVMAGRNGTPSTVFLYPSIVPLIPGDLVYYTMTGIVLKRTEWVIEYGWNLIIALVFMCVGFVLLSTLVHYTRRNRLYQLITGTGKEKPVAKKR